LIIPGYECTTIDIYSSSSSPAKNTLRIVTVYRSPSAPLSSNAPFLNYLNEVTDCAHPSLIVGDFNYPNIDWYTYSSPTASITPFLDFITSKHFNQFIDFPTRGKNILDLALCNSPLVKSAKPDIPLSDHVGISLSISFETTLGEKLKPTRNYLFANWDMINSQIAMHNWTIALSNKTATEAYCYFSEFLNSLLDIFVPIKRGKSSSGYPKYLSQLHDRLHKLHQVAPNCDTTHSLRVRFDNALKSFELKRESNAVNSKNPNHFFQFCKSRFKVNTSSLPGIIDSNGNVLLTNKDKATAFSKFFSKVQTPPLHSRLLIPSCPNSSFDLPFIPISDILNAISQLVPKCFVLHLGRLKTRSKYMLNGNFISPKEQVRDLGIFFTGNLHFGHHIDQITRKARSMCNLLLRSHLPLSGTLHQLVLLIK
ncbi:hypothetical protein PMAYCL1PPCAC_00232, partial [Pristionchus mayeri]